MIWFLAIVATTWLGIRADRPLGSAPARQPRRWAGAVHLLARRYQDYEQAVRTASRRRSRRAVDVDAQEDAEGTGWALHWATVGQNHLHDPEGLIKRDRRIGDLLTRQVARLEGPKGQHTRKLSWILALCERLNVRAEVEAKTYFDLPYVRRLWARPYVQQLHRRGLLQVKTLASMGAPNGGPRRLEPWHDVGFRTILSFTRYPLAKPGPSKALAWPVTDYYRGRARWSE